MPRTNQRDVNLAAKYVVTANMLANEAIRLLGNTDESSMMLSHLNDQLLDLLSATREHRRQPTARMVKGSRA